MGVPAGTCAPGGITELVGEIPSLCAARSNGSPEVLGGVSAPAATTGTED